MDKCQQITEYVHSLTWMNVNREAQPKLQKRESPNFFLHLVELFSSLKDVIQRLSFSLSLSSSFSSKLLISQDWNWQSLQPDDVIVYIDGAFDLFHVGHIDILREAKKLGTYLIVGVHSDQVVNKKRGNGYPIMNLHERVLSVLSCRVHFSRAFTFNFFFFFVLPSLPLFLVLRIEED
jgi:cytidyltransferase-like protein